MKNKPTIWLLSAYCSDSHAAWAKGLLEFFPDYNWHKLELPGRFFRWRIRGNPLSWLHSLPPQQPDLVLATSMVDLATLKGLHPRLANTPCVYYFHENQFAYPTSKQQHNSVDPQMVQLYGALAANQLVFNSEYNRKSFLNGVDQLLNKLPDEVPDNISALLEEKSSVVPVVIKPAVIKPAVIKPAVIKPAVIKPDAIKPALTNPVLKNINKNSEQVILWNHRWEYDKAPEVFADALIRLKQKNRQFKLMLLGDRAVKKPDALLKIEHQLSDNILINAKVPGEQYFNYLSQSDIVISSAIHEFQGLSMLEAVSAGATPLVPDDLCYKEQYAEMFRYPCGNSLALADKLNEWLTHGTPAAPDISYWHSDKLFQQWKDIISMAFQA